MIKRIPNILTLSRIILVPFLVLSFFLFSGQLLRVTSSVLFGVISITDFLDGYIARKFKAESQFGKCFDPIADKVLVNVTMIMLIYDQRAWVLPVLIIVLRETTVSGLREFVAKKEITIHVSGSAKVKTATQLIALTILLITEVNEVFYFIGNAVLSFSAILSLTTMFDYVKSTRHLFIKDII